MDWNKYKTLQETLMKRDQVDSWTWGMDEALTSLLAESPETPATGARRERYRNSVLSANAITSPSPESQIHARIQLSNLDPALVKAAITPGPKSATQRSLVCRFRQSRAA